MDEFLEIIKKDPKVQKESSKAIDKFNKQSLSTSSQIAHKVLIQSRVFKQVIKLMEETLSNMNIELEGKDNKTQFLEGKLGMPDSKKVEEMNRLDLNKTSSKDRTNTIMNWLKKHLLIVNKLKIK